MTSWWKGELLIFELGIQEEQCRLWCGHGMVDQFFTFAMISGVYTGLVDLGKAYVCVPWGWGPLGLLMVWSGTVYSWLWSGGMRVCISKFEAMVLCWKMVDCSIRVGGKLLHKVKEFIYLGVLLMSEDKIKCETEEIFLPGFNGTFHRQRAVDPVVDRLLWTRELISLHMCWNMEGNWLVRERLLTVTLWVMTVCRASEEICNKHPTLLASASLKIRATSNDSLCSQKHQLTYDINVWSVEISLSPTHTHLVRAEAHVAELQDRWEDGPDGGDLISMQTDGLEALNQKLEVLRVLLPLQFTGTTLEEDRERWWWGNITKTRVGE